MDKASERAGKVGDIAGYLLGFMVKVALGTIVAIATARAIGVAGIIMEATP